VITQASVLNGKVDKAWRNIKYKTVILHKEKEKKLNQRAFDTTPGTHVYLN
jgi:hypothetical protein